MISIEIIYRTGKLQMAQAFSRPTFKATVMIQPIIYSIITYMMYMNSGEQNFVAFVILGTGILSLWSCICFSSAGDIERERYMGTLEVIYSTPTNFKLIMLGKILGNTLLGLLPFAVSFVIIKLFFDGKFFIEDPLLFSLSAILTFLTFMGISFIFCCLFTLSRSSRILMNCIEYPIFILCGILFPIEVLPKWILPLSYILTPTWSIKVLRMTIEGVSNFELFYKYLLILVALTFVYFILANFLFNLIDKKTRIHATLAVS
jgi:ABC-2 type transport system permease protein